MHVFPRHCFAGQDTEHLPRNVTATNRHDETSARRDGLAGFGSDKLCSRRGCGVGVGVNLKSHAKFYEPFIIGLRQPPGGWIPAVASGPQVCGSYSWTGVPAFSAGSTILHASST